MNYEYFSSDFSQASTSSLPNNMANWSTPPQNIILAGHATHDHKDGYYYPAVPHESKIPVWVSNSIAARKDKVTTPQSETAAGSL